MQQQPLQNAFQNYFVIFQSCFSLLAFQILKVELCFVTLYKSIILNHNKLNSHWEESYLFNKMMYLFIFFYRYLLFKWENKSLPLPVKVYFSLIWGNISNFTIGTSVLKDDVTDLRLYFIVIETLDNFVRIISTLI